MINHGPAEVAGVSGIVGTGLCELSMTTLPSGNTQIEGSKKNLHSLFSQ